MKPVGNQGAVAHGTMPVMGLHILLLGGLGFILLMTLFLENGAWAWLRQPSESIKVRAVMKPGVDSDVAGEVAAAYLTQVPGLEAHVVDEAEGRSKLALQESWLQNLPETSVAPLPILIEFRHPATGRSTDAMQTFADTLSNDQRVEFVAFDATAHERLIRQLGLLQANAKRAKEWLFLSMLVVLAAAGAAVALAAGMRAPSIPRGAIASLVGVLLAVSLYRLARGGEALGTLPPLSWSLFIRGVLVMLVCFHFGHFVTTIFFRRNHERA